MFEGLIWFIIPILMVVMNDVMAYMFGFFFGRTPLIQLSPKKTWEGFIGGGVSTVGLTILLSYFMCQYTYFICPIGEYITWNSFEMNYSTVHFFLCFKLLKRRDFEDVKL